jgi:hypothetical protein
MRRHRNGDRHRVKDFLLYISIGVTLAGGAIGLGVYEAMTGGTPRDGLKWVSFAIMTFLVFFWLVRSHFLLRKNARFWTIFGVLGVIHVCSGVSLLFRTTVTSLVPFAIVTPLECYLLDSLVTRIIVARRKDS